MGRILDELGIYGYSDDDEVCIVSSLLTGDPLLLIGEQGSAKTALGCAIGAAFREKDKRDNPENSKTWFDYQAYDCSKMNFEDIMGFPDPKKMQEGEIGFIKSPMTAWNKDLVIFDEFNRQTPDRQSNIFEMIRSRTLSGVPTGTKYILACMNPYGMAGTEVLDEALVDRMTYYIYVNNFKKLDELSRDSVINHIGAHDAPALKEWLGITGEFDEVEGEVNEVLANAGDLLEKVLKSSAKVYAQLDKSVGEAYGIFINRYFGALTAELEGKSYNVPLSGRRAGLIKRALLAHRAVDIAMCDVYPKRELKSLKDAFLAVLRRTIPIGISTAGNSMDAEAWQTISTNIAKFNEFFTSEDPASAIDNLDVIYELLTTTDVVRKINILLHEVTDEISKNSIWKDVLAKTKDSDESGRNNIIVAIIANLMIIKPEVVPENIRAYLASTYRDHLDDLNNLGNNILLKGNVVVYSNQIQEQIMGYKNPFVKLQAKIIWEKELEKFPTMRSRISQVDITKIHYQVGSSCEALETLLSKHELETQDA
jgi:hypothetical protein